MTPERIAEIRERAEKATPGPWKDDGLEIIMDRKTLLCYKKLGSIAYFRNPDDRAFIAHARQDVPDLLAALEQATSRIAQLEAQAGENAFILKEMLETLAETGGELCPFIEGLEPLSHKDCTRLKHQNFGCHKCWKHVEKQWQAKQALSSQPGERWDKMQRVVEAAKNILIGIPLTSKEGRPDYGTMVTSDKIAVLRQALRDLGVE